MMRALYSLLFSLFLPLLLVAQIQKGDQILTFSGLSDAFTGPSTSFPVSGDIGRGIIDVNGGGSGFSATIATEYGFALTDRLFVGAVVGFARLNGNSAYALGPQIRYYFKNSPNLQIYGGLTAAYGIAAELPLSDIVQGYQVAAGFSVPITENVSFVPQLGYRMFSSRQPNDLIFQTQVDFLLGPNRQSSGPITSSFGRKTLLLGVGTTAIVLAINDGDFSIAEAFSPSCYYFLTPRLAPGFRINRDHISVNFNDEETDLSIFTLSANLRYYLVRQNRVTPFLEIGVGGSVIDLETSIGVDDSEAYLLLDGAVGVNFWLAHNLALEIGLSARRIPEFAGFLLSPSIGGSFAINKQ